MTLIQLIHNDRACSIPKVRPSSALYLWLRAFW